MIGGSADLTGSNNTRTKGMKAISATDYAGRFIHYGIREHGMAAAMNGMALHGGVIPYSGTFLVFSDYCRPSIRLAALMGERVIHVMTHDSIGLGEDGPTHQPVEHLAALRAIPNLNVFRPVRRGRDGRVLAARAAKRRETPSVLALTRQNLPQLRTDARRAQPVRRRRLRNRRRDGKAQVSIFATGSEVSIAVEAQKLLAAQGIATRVVSVPCFELFLAQPAEAPPRGHRRRAGQGRVEAAIRQGWDAIIGSDGVFVGMTGFGASAPVQGPLPALRHHAEKVAEAALSKLGKR